MIDLSTFSVSDGGASIFNDGVSGEVIAGVRFQKKSPDAAANYPDWQMVMIDEHDRELTLGFYYLNAEEQNYDKRLKAQATKLRHIYHVIYGDAAADPVVATAKELLDNIMIMCAKGSMGRKFKFVVTYGTINYPNKKGYLGVKTFAPFMTADLDAHIPINPKTDLMDRIVPDNEETKVETKNNDVPW